MSAGSQEKSEEEHWQQLMILAQKGDGLSYEKLLSQIYLAIKNFVIKKTGHLENAEDLTQESILAVHAARHTFDPTRKFTPWLFTIVRYKIIDFYRKQQRLMARETLDEKKVDTFSDAPTNNREERTESLMLALEQIPEEMRRAVVLMKIEGLSVKEAAQKEQVSEVALRSRASRAYKRLRLIMEKDLGI